jgi:N-acetylglucosamine kinase-like BadF-type ATPase
MRILAVDGGQSAIRLRHSSSERVVEVHGVSRLEGDTVDAVASSIAQGWLGSGFEPCDRVVLGLSTAPADAPSRERLCRRVNRVIGAVEVWLADDSVTCHAGALSLGWGVSVTAGTGVACLVVPEAGEPRNISGHGYLVGDEGGAFWIGREGVRAALRAFDGRGPATGLVEAAVARFGDLGDLGIRLHTAPRPVNEIAHFAPDVLAIADGGDAVARSVADDAASELVTLIGAGVSAAVEGSREGTTVPVAVGGRLLVPGRPLRRRLDERLAEDGSGATLGAIAGVRAKAAVRTADGSSLDGGLALGAAGGPGRYQRLVHVWREPVVVSAGAVSA